MKIAGPILFFVVLVTIVISVPAYFAARRRRQFKALADRLGLEFSQEDAFDLPEEYFAMEAFGRGSDRRAYNQIFGELKERQVLLTDYCYSERGNKGSQSCPLYLLHDPARKGT